MSSIFDMFFAAKTEENIRAVAEKSWYIVTYKAGIIKTISCAGNDDVIYDFDVPKDLPKMDEDTMVKTVVAIVKKQGYNIAYFETITLRVYHIVFVNLSNGNMSKIPLLR